MTASSLSSSVDNIVVIDLTSDDNEDAVVVQECKVEEDSPDDVADTSTSDVVQRDDVGDITTEDNPLPEDPVPEGMGSYANADGQRRSTRVAQVARKKKYHDGQLHLTYRGHPYRLSSTGSLTYDLRDGNPKDQDGVVLFSTSQELASKYVNGVCNINVTPDGTQKVSKEDVNAHVLGVIMAQKFSLHAGLKKFGDRAKEAVSKELTQIHQMGTYTPMDPDKMTPRT